MKIVALWKDKINRLLAARGSARCVFCYELIPPLNNPNGTVFFLARASFYTNVHNADMHNNYALLHYAEVLCYSAAWDSLSQQSSATFWTSKRQGSFLRMLL